MSTRLKSISKDTKFKYYLPNTDIEAWTYYQNYNHVYNKLFISQTQLIDCGPYGTIPKNSQ